MTAHTDLIEVLLRQAAALPLGGAVDGVQPISELLVLLQELIERDVRQLSAARLVTVDRQVALRRLSTHSTHTSRVARLVTVDRQVTLRRLSTHNTHTSRAARLVTVDRQVTLRRLSTHTSRVVRHQQK